MRGWGVVALNCINIGYRTAFSDGMEYSEAASALFTDTRWPCVWKRYTTPRDRTGDRELGMAGVLELCRRDLTETRRSALGRGKWSGTKNGATTTVT